MSRHKSLKSSGGGIRKKKSVLKRWERVDELKKDGRYKEGQLVHNLPKTKPPA